MDREILYSWSESDTKVGMDKYNVVLPEWMRFPVYALGFCGLFYIFSSYIFPMGHTWILIIIGVPSLIAIVVGLIASLTKPKIELGQDNSKYLNIYKDEIAINLEDICGSYKIDNIYIDSLAVKYITHWGYGGVGAVKGLRFKTIIPDAEVKVPLLPLLPSHKQQLKQVISVLRNQQLLAT
jgi:hypothetical protein